MTAFLQALKRYSSEFHAVVPFDPDTDRLTTINLTADNVDVTSNLVADTTLFSTYMDTVRTRENCRYLIGGYGEHRTMYGRSVMFDEGEEPRRLHLGMDVWGVAGTPVSSPLAGRVHSKAYNSQFGDYGATIILEHHWRDFHFYSLYGHLALRDLDIEQGAEVREGSRFAHFGDPVENGWWPPHLHLQIVLDLGSRKGDYPGVCRYSERESWMVNSPDPDLLCQLYRYV